jgi:hypothetical protein
MGDKMSNLEKLLHNAYVEAGMAGFSLERFATDTIETIGYCIKHPRMALPILTFLTASLVAACGPQETAVPPTMTATRPVATETFTLTATEKLTATATWGPPVGFDVTSTPSNPIETLAPGPAPTESAVDVVRAPTIKEMLVLDAGGTIPDYAQPYFDAMTAEKSRIAKQLGVGESDVQVFFKDNGLAQNASRWALFVRVNGKDKSGNIVAGVAWPVDKVAKTLGAYPADFQLVDPFKPDGPVKFDDAGYDWTLVGSPDAQMGFAGTRPMIMDGTGTATVDGKQVDTYGKYVLPGGLTLDQINFIDSSVWQRINEITEKVTINGCQIEKFRNCPMSEDVAFNDLMPWLQTQPSTFNVEEMSKLAPPVILDEVLGDMGEVIYPDFASRKYFHPRYDLTMNLQKKGPDGVFYPSIIIPVEIYNQSDPAHSFWVVADNSFYMPGYGYSIEQINSSIDRNMKYWREMKVVPLMTGTSAPGSKVGDQDFAALRTLANYPNKADMFTRFKAGDLGVFTVKGYVVLTTFDQGTLWH